MKTTTAEKTNLEGDTRQKPNLHAVTTSLKMSRHENVLEGDKRHEHLKATHAMNT